MKKHFSKMLIISVFAVLCCIGCSKGGDLTLKDGVLSWDATKDAAYYEVVMGDVSVTSNETKVDLANVCEFEGEHTITVFSVSDSNKKKELGDIDITAVALEKPAVNIMQQDDGSAIFTWKAQEGYNYAYDFHDGTGVQDATVEDDGTCRVALKTTNYTVFSVIARGTSKDNTYYIGNETGYRYQGQVLFDMSEMVKYPFYTISGGLGLDKLTFATTLKKGLYDLEMSFYLVDINGASLNGDGLWGRRIWNIKPQGEQLIWFCQNAVEGYDVSEGTLPTAEEMVTYKVENLEIDRYGEGLLDLADFNVNEMIVITDIKYNGKSVMAKGFTEHEDEVVFDTSKLADFLAVYTGTGTWHSENSEASILSIPVDLKDGVYMLEVSYQLMNDSGKAMTGNGLWGRRFTNENMDDAEMVWLCDYAHAPYSDGDDIPLPTTVLKSTFSGKVQNGKFKLLCLDFNSGDILAVKSVKKISGSSAKFNMSSLNKYKYVHKDSAEYNPDDSETLVVETTKCERGIFEVEVSYYAMDKDGYMLMGNGKWGRRMLADSEDIVWLCNTAPAEVHAAAKGTVPEPNKLTTAKMQVALNNKGRFTLHMHDFNEGEMIVIADVKYQGQSILKK